MVRERKWTYWHRVTEANGTEKNDYGVGQIVGLDRKEVEAFMLDPENKGFKVKARFQFLGKLPCKLETENPQEAIRIMKERGWIA
jgi:hypothetical protein